MEKLISMTAFVLEQCDMLGSDEDFRGIFRKYAEFLSQTLDISMFIPAKFVDGQLVILEEPEPIHTYGLEPPEYEYNDDEVQEYLLAKSNVLFEGFELITDEKNRQYFTYQGGNVFIDKCWALRHETIEDIVELQPTLTATAKKQIGL